MYTDYFNQCAKKDQDSILAQITRILAGDSDSTNGRLNPFGDALLKEKHETECRAEENKKHTKHAMEVMNESSKALMARLNRMIEDLYKDLDDLADARDGLRFLRD